jgi:hypothetical protein
MDVDYLFPGGVGENGEVCQYNEYPDRRASLHYTILEHRASQIVRYRRLRCKVFSILSKVLQTRDYQGWMGKYISSNNRTPRIISKRNM